MPESRGLADAVGATTGSRRGAARRWNRLDAVQRLAAAHPAQVDAERQRAGHVATAGRGAARIGDLARIGRAGEDRADQVGVIGVAPTQTTRAIMARRHARRAVRARASAR